MILFYSGDHPFDIARHSGLHDSEQHHEIRRASIDRALEHARPGLLASLLGLIRGHRGELDDAMQDPRIRRDLGLRQAQVQHVLGREPGAPRHYGSWF